MIEDFIYRHEGSVQDILAHFHDLFVNELDLRPKIAYGIPFYYKRKRIFYLNPKKNGTVDLAFVRGIEMSNSNGLMELKDRKHIMTIEIESINKMPYQGIMENIQEAIFLDETSFTNIRSKNKAKKS